MSGCRPIAFSATVGLATYAYHKAAEMELLGDRTRFFPAPAIAACAVSATTLFVQFAWKNPRAPLAAAITFGAIWLLGSTHQERRLPSPKWGP